MELPKLLQSVPKLLMFLRKTRSRLDREELPRGKHEIFSIVIPSFPSLFSAALTSLRRKSGKGVSVLSSCWYGDATFSQQMGGEASHGFMEVRAARISPQGTWWHTQRWNMGFDLCSLEVAGRAAWVPGWYRSDQSRCVGEWWWSGSARHSAYINGQTTTGRACIHSWQDTNAQDTDFFPPPGCLYLTACTHAQGDLDTEKASTGAFCVTVSCTLMELVCWHKSSSNWFLSAFQSEFSMWRYWNQKKKKRSNLTFSVWSIIKVYQKVIFYPCVGMAPSWKCNALQHGDSSSCSDACSSTAVLLFSPRKASIRRIKAKIIQLCGNTGAFFKTLWDIKAHSERLHY